MAIEDFLAQFVEGYLLGDLKNMSLVTVPPEEEYGGVGYPMLATILSGMELLGGLLIPSSSSFDPRAGDVNFLYFWDNYFSLQNPTYMGLGRLFRQLVRNGVSHIFVAKPGIFVQKGTNRQTSINTRDQEVHLDCNVFFREFQATYFGHVRPIIYSPRSAQLTDKETMQSRLDGLTAIYTRDSERLFSELPALHESLIDTTSRDVVPSSLMFGIGTSRASGPSGPLGPTGPLTVITTSQTATSTPMPSSTTTVPLPTKPSGILPPSHKSSDPE